MIGARFRSPLRLHRHRDDVGGGVDVAGHIEAREGFAAELAVLHEQVGIGDVEACRLAPLVRGADTGPNPVVVGDADQPLGGAVNRRELVGAAGTNRQLSVQIVLAADREHPAVGPVGGKRADQRARDGAGAKCPTRPSGDEDTTGRR